MHLEPITIEEASTYIRRRAMELVTNLITNRDSDSPPFTANEYARLLNIRVIKVDLGEADGQLLKKYDGYNIKLNINRRPERQNFTCAHEIGHIFLHELNREIVIDCDEFRYASSNSITREKERLCDIAAAELLMPEAVFSIYLNRFGLSIESVERLAIIFKVSIQSVAIRVTQICTEPCYSVLWKHWHMPRSNGFKGYLARKSVYIKNPSPISRAYDSDKTLKTYKTFEIGNAKKRCLIESKAFGYEKTRYVVSLVFPDKR